MKLQFDVRGKSQPDPFIFEDDGKFYLYVTAMDGVEAYSTDDPFGIWHFEGVVGAVEGRCDYWAPSVTKYNDRYYLYVSCWGDPERTQCMHVLSADSPLGPFAEPVKFYDHFSIDSHIVETADGLYLWLAKNGGGDRPGTRVFVEKLLDPCTPAHDMREAIVPSFDEEKFEPNKSNWHTVEGPFWFSEDGWQYVIYSGGCYQNDTYHLGYVSAKSDATDLRKVDFVKHTKDGAFDPLMIKNEFEEGSGHNSVLKYKGEYYAVYHARDFDEEDPAKERRTARICKLHVKDGVITAERYPDRV